MKLSIVLLMVFSLHAGAAGFGQTVTLSMKNVPVKKIFKEITRQNRSFYYLQ